MDADGAALSGNGRKLKRHGKCPVCGKRHAATALAAHVIEAHGQESLDLLKLNKGKPPGKRSNRKRSKKKKREQAGTNRKPKKKSRARRVVESAERRVAKGQSKKAKRTVRRRTGKPTVCGDDEARVQNRNTPDGRPLYGDWY